MATTAAFVERAAGSVPVGILGYHCIPSNEELRDENDFLNRMDTMHGGYVPIEDVGAWMDASNDDPDDKSFAEQLIGSELTSAQLEAAARVLLEEPQILIELYKLGIDPEEEFDKNARLIARAKTFRLFGRMVTAMLRINSPQAIAGALTLHRDEATGRTLLTCIAQHAQYEMRNAKKCCHTTAIDALKALGYSDPFAFPVRQA